MKSRAASHCRPSTTAFGATTMNARRNGASATACAVRRSRTANRSTTARSKAGLPLDPGEIRNLVHRISEAQQQVQPPLALARIGIVDRHMVEELIDRGPK